MLTGPDCVLFCGQAKGVPTHRMKHIEPASSFIARQNIRGSVPLGMTDVQASPGRIGEHVEYIDLGWQLLMPLGEGMAVGDALAGIPSSKRFLRLPSGLPFRFDQIEWILFARTRHQRGEYSGNRTVKQCRSPATFVIKARDPPTKRRSRYLRFAKIPMNSPKPNTMPIDAYG
jgi:hypothetical protein